MTVYRSAGTTISDHRDTHEDGGSDKLDLSNISGDLVDPQDPQAHETTHRAGNSDALSVANLANVLGVTEIKMDTAANLTAGTANRLCIETDTGRVLYDNGTSFVEMGLSEGQIALGNLGSHAHSELSGVSSGDHHTKTPPPPSFTEMWGAIHKPSASATWEDWDLSGEGVPASAVAYIMAYNSDTNSMTMGVRANGSTDGRDSEEPSEASRLWPVQVDGNQLIEIYAEDNIDNEFRVIGYWS